MKINDIKKTFKPINKDDYPELENYSLDKIYEDNMGIGGLYFAAQMVRRLKIKDNLRILDLGCGKGASSIFLAKELNLNVYAVDLWITASELYNKIKKNKMENKIIPLNLDITKPLPFPDEYFDIIFSMYSFHYFGSKKRFIKHLSRILKSKGQICIGNTCFNKEFHNRKIPDAYKKSWQGEFSEYHSPLFWKKLFVSSKIYKNISSEEVINGKALWEAEVLYNIKRNQNLENVEYDADEIMFGRINRGYPYLTHFILTGIKR